MAFVPGPLQINTGPTGIVVARRPCMLNVSLHTASIAAITHGRYSGRHPAITAFTAIFSTVSSTRSGGATATTSSGARVVPSNICNTRSRVGGTTGSPSVHPRSNIASNGSSACANSTSRAASPSPAKRVRNVSMRFGSTLIEPHPGRITGRSAPKESMPVIRCHSACDQPTVRSSSDCELPLMSVGTVSMS